MFFLLFIYKIKNYFWKLIVEKTRNTFFYPYLYKSYWNYLLKPSIFENTIFNNYYASRPNPGAGIGHQIANWISGYWFATQFRLVFVHIPFSSFAWDSFLGFGENEILMDDLLLKGFKKVRLPLFNEFNSFEVNLQKKIISSYSNERVVFVSEQDQGYRDQFGVIDILKEKFFNAPIRKKDRLFFNNKFLNIAVHIRRGDIIIGQKNKNPNLLLRWQGTDYFINILKNILENFKTDKPVAIYVFSQGKIADFVEFNQFDNIHYCLDVNPMDSFLHMVFADILITSKSSFSYKPALLNNGIKICPKDFWHGYPGTSDWRLVDNDGIFQYVEN